jgi:hypothetical protein
MALHFSGHLVVAGSQVVQAVVEAGGNQLTPGGVGIGGWAVGGEGAIGEKGGPATQLPEPSLRPGQ